MKKDLEYLKKYKTRLIDNLMANLRVNKDEASKILKIIEAEDLIRIEMPDIEDKPAEILTVNNHIIKSELSMTSHKIGNIVINSYLDWRALAGIIASSIETIAGFNLETPLLIAVGIFSSIISASEITDISIAENGTAIIMALQNHKKHKIYKVDENQCKIEANEILSINGYDEMDEEVFQEEVTRLIAYKCIDNENGILALREKVILHY